MRSAKGATLICCFEANEASRIDDYIILERDALDHVATCGRRLDMQRHRPALAKEVVVVYIYITDATTRLGALRRQRRTEEQMRQARWTTRTKPCWIYGY